MIPLVYMIARGWGGAAGHARPNHDPGGKGLIAAAGRTGGGDQTWS
jgi:hypothetical protein